VLGVRQAGEGQGVLLPMLPKGGSIIGSDDKNFRVTRGKRRILVPQAEEMGAAVGSHKSACEDEEKILLPCKVLQAEEVARKVWEAKGVAGC